MQTTFDRHLLYTLINYAFKFKQLISSCKEHSYSAINEGEVSNTKQKYLVEGVVSTKIPFPKKLASRIKQLRTVDQLGKKRSKRPLWQCVSSKWHWGNCESKSVEANEEWRWIINHNLKCSSCDWPTAPFYDLQFDWGDTGEHTMTIKLPPITLLHNPLRQWIHINP